MDIIKTGSNLYALRHCTRYSYDRPVTLGPHEIRLAPVPACRTPVGSYVLSVRPQRNAVNWYFDVAGNHVARVLFAEKVSLLEIDVQLTADLTGINPFDFLLAPGAERYPPAYPEAARPDLTPFLTPTESGAALQAWLAALKAAAGPGGLDTIGFLLRLTQNVQRDIAYVVRMEHGVQSSEDTLRRRSGSCRDGSWLLVQALRHLGFAGRFVSGYLVQLAGEGPDSQQSDRVDLHAWAEAYLPGAGWIGLDPTSGMLAAQFHIPLARAATPGLAAPVTGSVEPSRSQMDFSMSVRRVP